MEQVIIDQGTGSSPSVFRLFLRNTLPAIVAMMVSGVYVITDGMFVGQFVGSEGLAAVGLGYPLFMLIIGVGLMIGLGGGTLMSIHRGAQQLNKALIALFSSGLLLLIAALLAIPYLLYLTPLLLSIQGADTSLIDLTLQYLNVYTFTAFAVIASAAAPMFIRNDDSPNIATLIMVCGAVLNIILNYIFLAVLHLGIAGAAYATVISMGATFLATLVYFLSGKATVSLRLKIGKKAVQSVPAMMSEVLKIGSSVMVMHLYTGFVIALHNSLFLAYGTSASLSAFTIVGYLMSIFYMLAEGVGEGMQPLVSYFHGAKSNAKIRQLLQMGLSIVVILGLVIYLVFNLWPMTFIQWFNQDPNVIEKAQTGLKFHIATMFLDGGFALITVYFMALQKAKTALFISVANIVVQLPFLYVLPLYWGEFGIWIAVPVSNVVMLMIVFPILMKDIKQRLKPDESANVSALASGAS